MLWQLLLLIFLPFVGTALGSAGVFFLKKTSDMLQKSLSGFAAGVMTAASVWSLLIPSIDSSAQLGRLAFLPALFGFFLGFSLLSLLTGKTEKLTAKIKNGNQAVLGDSFVLFLAVTVHNFPEGMAVGMMAAALNSGVDAVSFSAALAFALAISLQNIPEGAVISMPLHSRGMKKGRSFFMGALSGAVEPMGAILTILFAKAAGRLLPVLFGFAAGAMLFVVADELIEGRKEGEKLPLTALCFGLGFALMMVMDVALG